jgi:hypothetical protein
MYKLCSTGHGVIIDVTVRSPAIILRVFENKTHLDPMRYNSAKSGFNAPQTHGFKGSLFDTNRSHDFRVLAPRYLPPHRVSLMFMLYRYFQIFMLHISFLMFLIRVGLLIFLSQRDCLMFLLYRKFYM